MCRAVIVHYVFAIVVESGEDFDSNEEIHVDLLQPGRLGAWEMFLKKGNGPWESCTRESCTGESCTIRMMIFCICDIMEPKEYL